MTGLKFRAWVDGFDYPFVVPSDSFSLAIHDTGHMVQMWSSDGIVDEFPASKVEQFTGLQDINRVDIYSGDVVYVAGYGNYVCEFPFYDLYNANGEGDIGRIVGNTMESPELAE